MTRSRTIVESIEVHGRREVDVPEDVLEDLLSVITEDAWEELDELSRATMLRYRKASSKEATRASGRKRYHFDKSNAAMNAGDRGKESMYDKKARDAIAHHEKRVRGLQSLERRGIYGNTKESFEIDLDELAEVLGSLSEEELGYLDELSKDTVKSYRLGARKDINRALSRRSYHDKMAYTNRPMSASGRGDKDRYEKAVSNRDRADSHVSKRLRGIRSAEKRGVQLDHRGKFV